MNIVEGTYIVIDGEEEKELEVYDHPEKGLCVWFNDYSAGSIDQPVSTDGDGHVPVSCTNLIFKNKI